MQRPPDVLMMFLELGTSTPFPTAWQDAAARFEEARLDYLQRRRYADAAWRFLEAARLLLTIGGVHANNAAANRLVCYRNAWAAFSAAGKRAEGRAVLEPAAEADPINADRIHNILESRRAFAPVEPRE